jgi:hypothetical protein
METAIATLTSPVILFFILGVLAALAKSDLAFPEALTKGLSLYLMAAIGLQGGVKLATAGLGPDVIAAGIAGMTLSFALPFLAFPLLRKVGRVDGVNAGAIAAHYGSVSVVTFVAGSQMLGAIGLEPEGHMVAVLALMETPAILSGLLLARRALARSGRADTPHGSSGELWREVLLNGSVVLLVGAFVIGWISGPEGVKPVMPLFDGLFRGALCLFLLDMGLIAARRLREARGLTGGMVVLGIVLPLVNGAIGAAVGVALGLAPGSAAALAVLTASASYIAVPAAMRLALPQADPGLSLAMSLGVTFPFNILVGISLYAWMVRTLLGGA